MINALKKPPLSGFIDYVIQEDYGSGDHTSLATIPENAIGQARLLVKETGVLAGVALAEFLFIRIDPACTVEIYLHDRHKVQPGDIAFEVQGPVRSLLQAERLVLNFMQRMSGIATHTRKFTEVLEGTKTKVLDTRKTTPGMRFFEKWAVRIGGGGNHRFGLYDMVLVKDNHIDFAGGIAPALKRVREYLNTHKLNVEVEVEARNMAEVQEILRAGGADFIMLDNFDFDQTREAVHLISGRAKVESSGNITLTTAREYAECGVDYISSGALTHTIRSMDLSLKAFNTSSN
jgi:nicotinate-nucleotide pyrophosphorylase (carboxylating)